MHKVKKCINLVIRFIFWIFYYAVLSILSLLEIVLFPLFWILRFRKRRVKYFAHISWKWTKQRPQFICIFLGRNNYQVSYSPIRPISEFTKEDVVDNTNTLDNIRIKNIPFNPNSKIIRKFKFLFYSFCFNYNTVIIAHPVLIRDLSLFLIKLKGIRIIYDCMDYYEYWVEKKYLDIYKKNEKKLVKFSNNILVSSEGLKDDLIRLYHVDNKVLLIRNGYDKDTFLDYDHQKFNFKKPNAVYVGLIDHYFDIDNVRKYAELHKDFHFYLIGPTYEYTEKYVENNPYNIHYLGSVEHSRVPQAINEADIMLMPFVLNIQIEKSDPVKTYEYLFFKKSVVSTYWSELDQFKGLLNYYHNYQEFEKAIEKSLSDKPDDKLLSKVIKKSSWDERLKPLLNIIK